MPRISWGKIIKCNTRGVCTQEQRSAYAHSSSALHIPLTAKRLTSLVTESPPAEFKKSWSLWQSNPCRTCSCQEGISRSSRWSHIIIRQVLCSERGLGSLAGWTPEKYKDEKKKKKERKMMNETDGRKDGVTCEETNEIDDSQRKWRKRRCEKKLCILTERKQNLHQKKAKKRKKVSMPAMEFKKLLGITATR